MAGGLLLLAPVLVFVLLQTERMAPLDMIDPTFYTAYLQNGPDLMARYGDEGYFWVRVGFILPARAAYLIFGAVPGFYVFRYALALLATVPAYLLLRRLSGPSAGALAVLAILTRPVILYAWGSDYPDSAAVSYLLAGVSLLALGLSENRRLARAACVVGAGTALSLAVHSQFIAAPLVGAAVAAYAALTVRRNPVRTLGDLLALAVVAGVTTVGLAVAARIALGSANIIGPTVQAVQLLRTPAQAALWHTADWRWALDAPFLLVPPLWLAAWVLVRRHAGVAVSSAERFVVLSSAAQVAVFGYLQFGGSTATLEYQYYFSMLWAGATLVLAFVLVALTGAGSGVRGWPSRMAAVLLVAVPWAFVPVAARVRFHLAPTGLVLAAIALLTAAVASRGRRRPVALLSVAVALLVTSYALTIGKPVDEPYLPGQVRFPKPYYGAVVAGDARWRVDRYRALSRLPTLVPRATQPGQPLLMWLPAQRSEGLQLAAGQYLWNLNALPSPLPSLSPESLQVLRARRPPVLLLLSDSGGEFASAVASLDAAGLSARVLQDATLGWGSTTVRVRVLQVTY